jgi:O-antigen/teichoic acid export membrane protein
VSSFVLVSVAVLGPHFLALWLDKPWIGESSKILLLLLPAYFVALLSGPASALLMGRGKLRGLTVLTVVEAAVNLGLSIALIFPFGIYGVALGTAIPLVFFRGIVFPYLLWKEIGFTPREYAQMHAPAIAVGLVLLVVVGGIAWVPVHTWPRLVALGLGVLVAFLALSVVLVPDARAWFAQKLRRT